MRLIISVDGYPHSIDSTDPETLGRWIVEIFARYPDSTPATLYDVQATASWVHDPQTGRQRADWMATPKFWDWSPARTPRELLAALGAVLDRAEALDRACPPAEQQ